MLGCFTLSQELLFKCWDTSHCPKTSMFKCWDTSHCPMTSYSSVGTLRTVPGPPTQVLGQFVLSQNLPVCLSVGTLLTVPRPATQVFGHFALSQDLPLNCWDTSQCPKTICSSVGTLRTVPIPLCSCVGMLHTVPRTAVQVLGHFALSHDLHV